MGSKKRLLFFLLPAALWMVSCRGTVPLKGQNSKSFQAVQDEEKVKIHMPGTVKDGVYLSLNSDFTVLADEAVWRVEKEEGNETLHLNDNINVWVSFSRTEGLTGSMLADFETSFSKEYLDGVKIYYPDARVVSCDMVKDFLAAVDISMSGGEGTYAMYQIMFLATDGEDGYIITSTLPLEEADALRPLVYSLVESIEFSYPPQELP